MTTTTTRRFTTAGLALAGLGVVLNIIILVLIVTSGYSLVELFSTSDFGFLVIAWTDFTALALAATVSFITGAALFVTTLIKNW